MSKRFYNLKKIPAQPAARALAMAGAKLKTKLASPPAAPIADVLAELDENGAVLDMLRLLSVALPPRERVWWACLAGRDLEAAIEPEDRSAVLAAAEAWVFKPTEENLQTIHQAIENADLEDETTLCGTAALYADGHLGPGDLAQFDAPPGGAETMAFVMNGRSLAASGEIFEQHGQVLIDRALDIARGGNGQVASDAEPAPAI